MSLRYIALLCGLAFFGGLGVMVGQRMPAQALTVMVGIMAGAATSIPTSLLVVWFAMRNVTITIPATREPEEMYTPDYFAQPVAGGTPPPTGYQSSTGYASPAYPDYTPEARPTPQSRSVPVGRPTSAPRPVPRHFTIIGNVEADEPDAD